MEKIRRKSKKSFLPQEGEEWFSQLIHAINTDKVMFESGTLPKEKATVYSDLFTGKVDKLISNNKKITHEYFTQKIVVEYLNELLGNRKAKVNQLALDVSGTSLLVWAEINDDDENTEKDLILSEAKINAAYSDHDYYISTTIVEKNDNVPIPDQYQMLNLK